MLNQFILFLYNCRAYGSDKNENESHRPAHKTTCHPKSHFVFVKVHKCASSTISAVFREYALNHKLVMALPEPKTAPISAPGWLRTAIGWPLPVSREHIKRIDDMENKGMKLDAVFHHHHFNALTWKRLMPADTVYLAVLREPLDQFRSVIDFQPSHVRKNIKGPDDQKVS